MSFIDKVKVTVLAGDGGNGKLSFRHEKFIDKGGPDGGDGGNGGDVILVGSRNQNTLAAFRYQKEVKADPGLPGGQTNKHGRSGQYLLVPVPVGTMATDSEGRLVADLILDGQKAIVAKGGKGGFGNAHFVSSRRQAPKFAENGEPGEKFELTFELKLIADVGLVGMPNAGKSTLLATISNARPEIADYAFTTLTPNLGVVDIDSTDSLLMADIPGLIEGAAEGKGLGHDFLRHVERTAVILHLIDAYQEDVAQAYKTIRNELKAYDQNMAKRPELVAITKIEGLDQEIVDDLMAQLRVVVPAKTKIMAISSPSGAGIKELKYALQAIVKKERSKADPVLSKPDMPILRITDTSAEWFIDQKDNGTFVVTGHNIERFAKRTDFMNEESVQRLRDIMRKVGIIHGLVRKGIKPGQTVHFSTFGSLKY
jgi:GTP-binding protein